MNEKLGHAVGDDVLRKIGQVLVGCLRECDIVARLGGDEFAVFVGQLSKPEDAGALAKRIVEKITAPVEVAGGHVLLGASVGIAIAPIDGDEGELVLNRADLALNRARSAGRGAYRFYEKGLDAAVQDRRNLEAALGSALLNGEFRLVFQPMVNLAEIRICACEALVRWAHPERGLLGPAAFIAAAEESGLIGLIGEWVLREACAVAATWPGHVSVAVNLSPVQFRVGRNLVGQVKSALLDSGLEPRRLELEITESVSLADDDGAVLILRDLKALGVKVALDDFGTGYSSLSYLLRFPFDKLKIDRSFVQASEHSADSLAIVKAVVALARSLGMATTAEGIETEAQLNIVRKQGCTEVQGFLFSVPLPVQVVSEFVARFHPQKSLAREIEGPASASPQELRTTRPVAICSFTARCGAWRRCAQAIGPRRFACRRR